MAGRIIKIIVSILMIISPSLPVALSLPQIPSGRDLELDERFELVWSDEFSGDEIDTTKWDTRQSVPTLHWGAVRQGGYWHSDMLSQHDGNLVITTKYIEQPLAGDGFGTGYYTACISTAGLHEWLYGYFECRCILPPATGMWSAFWMMNEGVYQVNGSGTDGTEVDIYESMYYKDAWWGAGNAVIGGIHYDGYGEDSKGDSIGKFYVNNPYEEFNTYGLEWNKDEYIYYINGVECGRLSTGGVSQNPENLILSCEVAGKDGVANADRHGTGKISIEPDGVDHADFIVDYVRVYQYKEAVQ